MQGIPRRPEPAASRFRADEAGFGLIEVMVSMVLLVMLALSTFALIDQSTAASSKVRSRQVAANLAHADLDRMRQLKFATASSDAYKLVTSSPPIDGVAYTVTSTATWTTDGGTEVSCTTPSGDNAAYLHIKSSVTWPGMGTVAPVVADSILTPRGKEIDRTAGSVMFSVQNRDAGAVSGVAVTIGSQSLTTGTAGCVFFPQVSSGTYNVTFSKFGYYSTAMASPGSTPVTVTAGSTSNATVSFDVPSTFNPITVTSEEGAAIPWYSVSMVSQAGIQKFTSGSTVSAFNSGKVWPYNSGYSFYGGSCAGNDPTLYASNFPAKFPASSIVPAAGATVTTARAYMRLLSFTLSGVNVGDTVYAYIRPYTDSTYTSMTGCTETQIGSTTLSSLTQNVTMPYGYYALCVDNNKTPTSNIATTPYRYYKWKSATAPINAFHSLPKATGITLRSGVPVADGATPAAPAAITLAPATSDQCS